MSTYRIEAIERMTNSANGNPRFKFALSNAEMPYVTATSRSDAAFAYEVGNPGYRVGDTVEVTWYRGCFVADMRSV